MKVLALNPPFVPGFCRSARWAAISRGRVQRHPDYMLVAVAVLEKAGHEVRFIDGPAEGRDRSYVESALREFRPDLMFFHTTTPSIYNDLQYAALAKSIRSDCTTLAVGAHVTAVPENTFAISASRDIRLDAIALGEYDFTVLDVADGKAWATIPGLAIPGQGGACILTGHREPVDVNLLPFPAWHHIDPNNYPDAGKRFPFLTLLHSRGCVGNCTFCRDTPLSSGRKIRNRDVSLVLEEMEYDLHLFPQLREIMFEADTFAADPKYTEDLCEEMIRRSIGKKVCWSCNARVDIDLDLLPLMKRAGCRMLMTGFEFGTQAALDAVNKGVTLEQSRKFAETAKKMGFILHGCFMIGAPNETEETAMETIRFAKSLPCDTIQISGICPYPGTPLYQWAVKQNYLLPKDWTEWVGPDHEQVTLLDYPQMSKGRIDYYIDRGLREFYMRPRQILRMMLNIRDIGDLKRKIYGVRSFINYFSKGRQ